MATSLLVTRHQTTRGVTSPAGRRHMPMFDDPALVARTMLAHLDGATAAAGS